MRKFDMYPSSIEYHLTSFCTQATCVFIFESEGQLQRCQIKNPWLEVVHVAVSM